MRSSGVENLILRPEFPLAVGIAALLFFASVAGADSFSDGLRLLSLNRYGEAIDALSEALKEGGRRGGEVDYALGRAFLARAEVLRAVHYTASIASAEYLESLREVRKERSVYLPYFLGIAYYEAGEYHKALAQFEGFRAANPAPPWPARANVWRGMCYLALGNSSRASSLIRSEAGNLKGDSELAFALMESGNAGEGAHYPPKGMTSPEEIRAAALALYLRGNVEGALGALKLEALYGPSLEEGFGEYETLRFYDPSALRVAYTIYLRQSLFHLDSAAREDSPDISRLAEYYALEAAISLADWEGALSRGRSFLSRWGGGDLAHRAKALLGRALWMRGDEKGAGALWREAMRGGDAEDLSFLAVQLAEAGNRDILEEVGKLLGAGGVGTGGGRSQEAYSNWGWAMYRTGDYPLALEYLEMARDKSHKNSTEHNSPLFLAHLAEVYYRSREYPESLEIYFEMGKLFPEVRHIQDNLQGIYSLNQSGEGEARINI
ncbi:MAG: tetratricopeptide repeat protein [bacterium]